MKTTPDQITNLLPHQVFVFGSNRSGRHGRGAAHLALRKFGARPGQGVGLMGQSYGIATKGRRMEVLSLAEIAVQVNRFIQFAAAHPEMEFLVTKLGTGLAGYSVREVREACFAGLVFPPNVALPAEFQSVP